MLKKERALCGEDRVKAQLGTPDLPINSSHTRSMLVIKKAARLENLASKERQRTRKWDGRTIPRDGPKRRSSFSETLGEKKRKEFEARKDWRPTGAQQGSVAGAEKAPGRHTGPQEEFQ